MLSRKNLIYIIIIFLFIFIFAFSLGYFRLLRERTDLLPALKGEVFLGRLTGSPHLFEAKSVIYGAVGAARDPPSLLV